MNVIVLPDALRPAAMLPCCAQTTLASSCVDACGGQIYVTTAQIPAAITTKPLPIQERTARFLGFASIDHSEPMPVSPRGERRYL